MIKTIILSLIFSLVFVFVVIPIFITYCISIKMTYKDLKKVYHFLFLKEKS